MKEREALYSDPHRGSKLMGDDIRITAKVFDIVFLTGEDDDESGDSVRDIGDDEDNIWRVHGGWSKCGVNRDGIGSPC